MLNSIYKQKRSLLLILAAIFLLCTVAFFTMPVYATTNGEGEGNGEGTDPTPTTYVAQIERDGELYQYESLQAAVDAAKSGETVTVIKDHTVVLDDVSDMASVGGKYYGYVNVAGESIVIDFNGCTITAELSYFDKLFVGVFVTENDGKLILTDNSEEKSGGANLVVMTAGQTAYALICNFESGCMITINGGNYSLNSASDCLIYSGCGVDNVESPTQGVFVNGGTFKLENVATGNNDSPWYINVSGQASGRAYLRGGTFCKYDITHQHWTAEATMVEGYGVTKDDQNNYIIVSDPRFFIYEKHSGHWGNWGYLTFDDALYGVTKNDSQVEINVGFYDKEDNPEERVKIKIDEKEQLDLSIKEKTTIQEKATVNILGDFFIDANTTINGTVNVAGDVTINSGAIINGTVNVTGKTTINADTTINGTLNANGGIEVAADLFVDGTVAVTGDATIANDVAVCGVADGNAGNFKVTGDLIVKNNLVFANTNSDISLFIIPDPNLAIDVDGNLVVEQGKNVTIGDGVVANVANVTLPFKSTLINNGTLDFGDTTEIQIFGTLTNNGTIKANTALEIKAITNLVEQDGVLGAQLAEYSTAVPQENVSSNTYATRDGGETLVDLTIVGEYPNVLLENDGQSYLYSTLSDAIDNLSDAIDNAVSGDVITLLTACEENLAVSITENKNITIDLNKQTCTLDSLQIGNGATLTIKNGTLIVANGAAGLAYTNNQGATGKTFINNQGTLVLQNVDIKDENAAVDCILSTNGSGKTEIVNTSISTIKVAISMTTDGNSHVYINNYVDPDDVSTAARIIGAIDAEEQARERFDIHDGIFSQDLDLFCESGYHTVDITIDGVDGTFYQVQILSISIHDVIEMLEKEVESLTGLINENKANISTNSDNISTNAIAIADHTTKLQQLQTDLLALKKDVEENYATDSELANEVAALESKITNAENDLNSEIDALTTRVGALESGLNEAKTNIQTNADDILTNTTAINKNANDLFALQGVVDVLEDKVDANNTTLTNSIETLKAALESADDALEASIDALSTKLDEQVAQLKGLIGANKENVLKNAQEIAQLTKNLATVKGYVGDLIKNVEENYATNEALSNAVAGLNTALAGAQTELEESITALEEELEKQVAALDAAIKENGKNISANATNILNLTTELGKLTTTVEDLSDAVDAKDEALKQELETAIANAQKALQESIDALTKKLDQEVTELKESIATKADATALTTQIARIDSLTTAVSNLETKDTELEEALEKAIEDADEAVEDAIATLREELAAKASELNALISGNTTEIGKNAQAIADVADDLSDLTTTVSTLKTNLEKADADLAQDIADLDTALTAADTAIKASIAALETKLGEEVEKLNDLIDTNKDSISANAADIAEQTTKLSALETAVDTLATRLDAKDSELAQSIASLKSSLEKADDALEASIAALQTAVEDLEDDLADATENIIKNKGDIATNANNVATLATELSDLTDVVDELAKELAADYATKDQFATLKTELENADASINSAISALQTKLDEKIAELMALINTNSGDVDAVSAKVEQANELINANKVLAEEYASDKDEELKAELLATIEQAKASIYQAIAQGDQATKDELGAEIDKLVAEIESMKQLYQKDKYNLLLITLVALTAVVIVFAAYALAKPKLRHEDLPLRDPDGGNNAPVDNVDDTTDDEQPVDEQTEMTDVADENQVTDTVEQVESEEVEQQEVCADLCEEVAEVETVDETEEIAETENVAENEEIENVDGSDEESTAEADEESQPEEGEQTVDQFENLAEQDEIAASLTDANSVVSKLSLFGGYPRKSKTLEEKIQETDEQTKQNLNELAEKFLSFKKIKRRDSKKFITFNVGRTRLARIVLSGKSIKCYFALDPNEFATSKYHHKDVSEKSKYAKTPFLLKVRSPRSLKRAKALIDEMVKKYNVK